MEITALSPRQREILELAADGLYQPEIAERLGISVNTVSDAAKVILLRLHARTIAQAVAVGLRSGQLPIGDTVYTVARPARRTSRSHAENREAGGMRAAQTRRTWAEQP